MPHMCLLRALTVAWTVENVVFHVTKYRVYCVQNTVFTACKTPCLLRATVARTFENFMFHVKCTVDI